MNDLIVTEFKRIPLTSWLCDTETRLDRDLVRTYRWVIMVNTLITRIRRYEMTMEELNFEIMVEGSPADVFYAFSTAQGWRDWMCDSARFESRQGGSYQLSWNLGWYAAGSVLLVDRPHQLKMTWRGVDDPATTEVVIKFSAADDRTKVNLRHTGFGEDPNWEPVHQAAKRGWDIGLENLISIFQAGADLRITRRPMLGVFLNDFDESVAQELNVPVTSGIRIDKPVEGLGAAAAGLKPDDVVVKMNGKPISGFTDLAAALAGQHAGDEISVVFYRGPEQMTVPMTLSGRQLAEVPLDPAAIADRVRPINASLLDELRQLFDGVSEEEADYTPGPDEWSAKGILAHLIDSERYTRGQIGEFLYDGEREYPDQAGNVDEVVQAIVKVTPTVSDLLDRLELSKRETTALLSGAGKLKARKGALWRLGQGLLQLPGQHERNHMEQIQLTIEAAREAGG
jgi:uncharacterized protein YndB with AHSA1/START domain